MCLYTMDLRAYFTYAFWIACSFVLLHLSVFIGGSFSAATTYKKNKTRDWIRIALISMLFVFLLPFYGKDTYDTYWFPDSGKEAALQVAVFFGLVAWRNFASAHVGVMMGGAANLDLCRNYYSKAPLWKFIAVVIGKFIPMLILGTLLKSAGGVEPIGKLWYISITGSGIAMFAYYVAIMDFYLRYRFKSLARLEEAAGSASKTNT